MITHRHTIASHYLGRTIRPDECRALDITPSAPVQLAEDFNPYKKDCLIVAACYATSLRHYLRSKPEFTRDHNIHIVMTQSAYIQHMLNPTSELIRRLFGNADVILCHNFLGEFEKLNVIYNPGKASRRAIVFAPPSNRTFWPICTNSGIELAHALKSGRTREQVWQSFVAGTFDCCFDERTAEQKTWATQRELGANIKLVPFVEHAFRDCKLWFTSNHPTYNLIAWVGSEFLRLIGYPADSYSRTIAYPPEATSLWNACPETRYEFDYYKLRYPLRWPMLDGGPEFYRRLIMDSPLYEHPRERA